MNKQNHAKLPDYILSHPSPHPHLSSVQSLTVSHLDIISCPIQSFFPMRAADMFLNDDAF